MYGRDERIPLRLLLLLRQLAGVDLGLLQEIGLAWAAEQRVLAGVDAGLSLGSACHVKDVRDAAPQTRGQWSSREDSRKMERIASLRAAP